MTSKKQNEPAVVFTIAGFDPSGGAGIIADIKTFVSFGCRPVAAVTSLTFQNSEAVFGAINETGKSVRAQVLPLLEEFHIAAVKIGMLPTSEIVLEVARLIREENLPAPVIDPVLRSTSGHELMEKDALDTFLDELLPLARLITPNIQESETLTGLRITNEDEMRFAAVKLRKMGARAALIKGGHLPPGAQSSRDAGKITALPAEAIDVLDDKGHVTVFRGDWIDTPPVRGTGCMLSSAIAACLGQGMTLEQSIRLAKRFVADAIRNAPRLGPDPVTLELTEFIRLEE